MRHLFIRRQLPWRARRRRRSRQDNADYEHDDEGIGQNEDPEPSSEALLGGPEGSKGNFDKDKDNLIRFIGVDRPGYGNTSPLPGRTINDWTDDLLLIADDLNIEKDKEGKVLNKEDILPYQCLNN